MASSTGATIFTSFSTAMGDQITSLLPTVLGYGAIIFGIVFVVRKIWGFSRGV